MFINTDPWQFAKFCKTTSIDRQDNGLLTLWLLLLIDEDLEYVKRLKKFL